ncbi:MAG TPA: hypothetical protein VHB22_07065, partial [Hyphomicrobium sp.]|nr:hypothetical protein [Hyphomicrobium sp.]
MKEDFPELARDLAQPVHHEPNLFILAVAASKKIETNPSRGRARSCSREDSARPDRTSAGMTAKEPAV